VPNSRFANTRPCSACRSGSERKGRLRPPFDFAAGKLMQIDQMTMPDFLAGLAATRTVLIPVGATEEHGPHLRLAPIPSRPQTSAACSPHSAQSSLPHRSLTGCAVQPATTPARYR